MGLFAQRPEEPGPWASLPGEPLDEDAVGEPGGPDIAVDPLEVGLGAETTSIAFPADPAPAPEDGGPSSDTDS